MSCIPGRIMPPRNTPFASSASTVTAVPALTMTHAGGKRPVAGERRQAATRDAQRSAPVAPAGVAVGDAAARLRSRLPFRRQAPARELRLDVHARRFARDVDAEMRYGRGRSCQSRNEACRSHCWVSRRARATEGVQAPLQPAVAGVEDEFGPRGRPPQAPHARRSVISPERKRARRGPSASTNAPLASTPAPCP